MQIQPIGSIDIDKDFKSKNNGATVFLLGNIPLFHFCIKAYIWKQSDNQMKIADLRYLI